MVRRYWMVTVASCGQSGPKAREAVRKDLAGCQVEVMAAAIRAGIAIVPAENARQ